MLVFADADVAFAPHAVRAAVDALRAGGFALVSPFPREVADDWLSRLVQPLLAWSVAATLPLRLAEGSTHPAHCRRPTASSWSWTPRPIAPAGTPPWPATCWRTSA